MPRVMEVEATSPRPSEWTSVRISPEEEDTVGQDVLAVRVLVTSEDSSSDTEFDDDSITGPCEEAGEERPQLPECPPPSKPLARRTSLQEPLARPVSLLHHEEPQAMSALQRAHSLQSPAPSKYQSWRREFQSSSTSMKQRTPSPPKEPPPPPPPHPPPLPPPSLPSSSSLPPCSFSSASVPGHTTDNPSPPQVPAYNLHSPQVSRGDLSPTPIYLRRARAQGIAKEIPLYLPHGSMLENTKYSPVSPGEDLRSPEGCQEAQALGSTKTMPIESHLIAGKGQNLPSQNPGVSESPLREQTCGPETSRERKLDLKKLVLTQEQKTELLDWNGSTPAHKVAEQFSQESAENGRGHSLKPICSPTLCQAVKEKLLSQRRTQGEMQTPAVKREVRPPKSPLKAMANVILRSWLPNSEGGKKSCPKPESKTLPRGQQHAFTRSFSFRKPGSNKDGDQPSPGRHMAKMASAFFSLASPTSKAAQASDHSLPESIRRTQSLSSRPSKMFFETTSPPPRNKIEDVPTLLEKVSLQDATHAPKTGAPSISCPGHKDKSFVQECKQRKDIGDFFYSPRGSPGNRVPSLEKLVQSFGSGSVGQVAHPSSTGQDARPGAPVTEVTSSSSSTASSSAEEDLESQLSSRIKEKVLRRRRRLEKQLAKQEQLKRLHKAQVRKQQAEGRAIQRQLEEVEEQQTTLAIQAVGLEKVLRGEADSGTQDKDQLLQEWFETVLEKNRLTRYESELQIMAQELELEDRQSRLAQKLRQKMLKDEGQKDASDLKEEQEILQEMMQVIEQRNELVDSLEEQRVNERTQDQHLENFALSRGYLLSRT